MSLYRLGGRTTTSPKYVGDIQVPVLHNAVVSLLVPPSMYIAPVMIMGTIFTTTGIGHTLFVGNFIAHAHIRTYVHVYIPTV